MMENEGFRRAISLSSIFSSRGRYGWYEVYSRDVNI